MALTPSNMLPLGTKAPDFILWDTVSQNTLSIEDLRGKNATVIMFICNHCPYVLHVNQAIVSLAKDYQALGVGFIAISTNDISSVPEDSPEQMTLLAQKEGYTFPYLYDESQAVAKAYDAACTPDFYVFDKDMLLRYRGRLDNSRPNSGVPTSGKDLRNALDAILHGNPVDAVQYPSMGCNIKWKA